jgi:hypothetical protein
MPLAPGTKIGGHEIVALMGAGGCASARLLARELRRDLAEGRPAVMS